MKFPDVEAMTVSELVAFAATHNAEVSGKWPNPLPTRHVRAWRTGGVADNRVLDRPIITVTAKAESTVAAAELLGDCRHHVLNNFGLLPLVRRVEEVTGPYYDPDPETRDDRYTFSFQLSVRAAR